MVNAALEVTSGTASRNLQAGDVLGNYQLLCPIAHGGMGQIWVACRTGRLGVRQLVAIKTALPRVEGQEGLEKLFYDEARVAALISHPNVCKTYELEEDRGILYLAMEWIDGASLANLIPALPPPNRLNYAMAAHIVAQACAGLHAAHDLTDEDGVALHVVHRDATPHNILISSAGEVKVVDFGVVKARDQAHQATVAGELKGKISYVAPEQLMSRRIDRRTDIFALGCCLYYATTGKRAFSCESAGQTMVRIMQGEYTPASTVIVDYPAKLAEIVNRALANNPDARFQTAEELRQALESFISEYGSSIRREDVAALIQETLGAALDQRRAEIRTAQKLFESSRGSMAVPLQASSGSYPVASTRTPAAHLMPSTAVTLRSVVPSTSAAEKIVGLRLGRGLQIGIGVAAILVAVAVLRKGSSTVAVANRSPGAPHTTPSTHATGASQADTALGAAAALPSAAGRPSTPRAPSSGEQAPALVTIDVHTIPAHAIVTLDNESSQSTPCTFLVPRDDSTHVLKARAAGYSTLTHTLTLDRSQSLVLDLIPQKPSSAAQSSPRSSPPQERKSPESPKTAAEAPLAPAPPSRARLPIDVTDPFHE